MMPPAPLPETVRVLLAGLSETLPLPDRGFMMVPKFSVGVPVSEIGRETTAVRAPLTPVVGTVGEGAT